MSSTISRIDTPLLPAPRFGRLFRLARHWLQRQRQAAMLCHVDRRLREDAGLPSGEAPENIATALPVWALGAMTEPAGIARARLAAGG